MILGRGRAQTNEAIVDEYQQFLRATGHLSPKVLGLLQAAAAVLCRRVAKPIAAWTDADILALFQCPSVSKSTAYYYTSFLGYCVMRGYHQPSIPLLAALPCSVARLHQPALHPIRQWLVETARQLHYRDAAQVGDYLRLLIWLLAVVGKPLAELTYADVERFAADYQTWYRAERRATTDPRLRRLTFFLIHRGTIVPPRTQRCDDDHFAALGETPLRVAIRAYLRWCGAKYARSTVQTRRAGLSNFIAWCGRNGAPPQRLDEVTRGVALAYATYLKEARAAGRFSGLYHSEQYASMRLFYDFALDEGLASSPTRNPFGKKDTPREPDPVPRYLTDHEVAAVLDYCVRAASLRERTVILILLHTGIRAAELAALKRTDIVQVQGVWKVHVHAGKGLKDRLIPLTDVAVTTLHAWQETGWERASDHLFTHHGRPYTAGNWVGQVVRDVGAASGVAGLTPHRFRHTFAVVLINYGLRESALQKLLGHASLSMTLEYGRILDRTVEESFGAALAQMREGPLGWVPSFFVRDDFTRLIEGDAVDYIRLPHGLCRRNPKLHCESDVKCFLCERYCASHGDLPVLRQMHERFERLNLPLKALVVQAVIDKVDSQPSPGFIPINTITRTEPAS